MSHIPSTIAELRQLAQDQGLDLVRMRFFLGQDCREPRCFGLYYNPQRDRYIVYKNKADGTRAIRYEGPDQAEAVRIIHEKIGDEIMLRRQQKTGKQVNPSAATTRTGKAATFILTVVVLAAIAATVFWLMADSPEKGYYSYNDDYYYYLGDTWYCYDSGYWNPVYGIADDVMDDYYIGTNSGSFTGISFESTDYYTSYEASHDSSTWSSSDSYDWDSSSTDWDSDW